MTTETMSTETMSTESMSTETMSNETMSNETMSTEIMSTENKKPYLYDDKKLHIFDLDDTLVLRHRWLDNYTIKYEQKMKTMLQNLKKDGKILAMASHNSGPKYELLRMGVLDLFDVVIGEYPRNKDDMIKEILQKTGCDVKDAVFYDDNIHNIKRAESLNVQSYHVKENGIEL